MHHDEPESEEWHERRDSPKRHNAREIVVGVVLPVAAMVITIAISAGALYDRMRNIDDDLSSRIAVLNAKIDAHNLEAEYWKKEIGAASREVNALQAKLAKAEADINAHRREAGIGLSDCKEALKELQKEARQH